MYVLYACCVRSFFLFCPAVGTAALLLEPHHDAPIVEDMVAVEQSYDLALYEPLQANGALLLGLPNLHLLYPLQPRLPQSHQLLL